MPNALKFQALPARDALVLEYLGDGNALDTNDGTKATLTATNVSYASCPVGYQKQWGVFNGASSSITSSNYNTTALGSSFHIMWWGTVDSLSKIDKYLFMRGSGTNQNSILCGYVASQFEFFSNGGHSGTDPRSGSGLTIPDTTKPHMYEYRYDGTTWSGYVDGGQAFSVSRTFSLGTSSSTIYVGRSDLGNYFPGKLGAFRIFNRALTETERLAYWHEFNRQLAGGSDFGAYIPQPTAHLDAVGEDTFYDVALGTKATRTAGTVANDNVGLARAISGPNQSWTSVSGDSFVWWDNSGWKLEKNNAAVTATGINTANTVGAVFYWPTGAISTAQQTYIENMLKTGRKPYAFRSSYIPAIEGTPTVRYSSPISGSTIYDSSGNGNNLTTSGSISTVRKGQDAVYVGAGGYANNSSITEIPTTNGITIVAWMDCTNSSQYRFISAGLKNSDGTIQMLAYNGYFATIYYDFDWVFFRYYTFPTSGFHRIALAVNSSGNQLYIDGAPVEAVVNDRGNASTGVTSNPINKMTLFANNALGQIGYGKISRPAIHPVAWDAKMARYDYDANKGHFRAQ